MSCCLVVQYPWIGHRWSRNGGRLHLRSIRKKGMPTYSRRVPFICFSLFQCQNVKTGNLESVTKSHAKDTSNLFRQKLSHDFHLLRAGQLLRLGGTPQGRRLLSRNLGGDQQGGDQQGWSWVRRFNYYLYIGDLYVIYGVYPINHRGFIPLIIGDTPVEIPYIYIPYIIYI